MKKFLFAVLFAFATSAMAVDTYFVEDEHGKIVLTDEPCIQSVADEHILPQYHAVFKTYKLFPKSAQLKKQLGNKTLLYGCYSDDEDIAPNGLIVYVSELGSAGFQDFSVFKKIVVGKET